MCLGVCVDAVPMTFVEALERSATSDNTMWYKEFATARLTPKPFRLLSKERKYVKLN